MARVSVIIPSRNERFLVPTVNDLLAKAAGDVEIVVVCDGYWEHGLPADKRVKVLHFGRAQGMRPAINAATQIATGDYFLKSDGHCLFDEGWDTKLTADYLEDNWVLTPRRYPLDAENWCIESGYNARKYPVDAELLSCPLPHLDDPTRGLHGEPWTARRDARKHILLDTDLSAQGSAWFMSRKHWARVGPMDIALFGNFYAEAQELGLKTQILGGAMMRTKNTWYAHLRKGKRWGRGYVLGPEGHKRGAREMLRLCAFNLWPGQVRTLQSVLEDFMPVPGWPSNLEQCFADIRAGFSFGA